MLVEDLDERKIEIANDPKLREFGNKEFIANNAILQPYVSEVLRVNTRIVMVVQGEPLNAPFITQFFEGGAEDGDILVFFTCATNRGRFTNDDKEYERNVLNFSAGSI
jgi:hypothetical protein